MGLARLLGLAPLRVPPSIRWTLAILNLQEPMMLSRDQQDELGPPPRRRFRPRPQQEILLLPNNILTNNDAISCVDQVILTSLVIVCQF